MTTGRAITIDKAFLGYGKEAVLSSVSLDIQAGTMTCVFGRNGSGKTTLLKSVAGLLPVLDGSISINDSNLMALSNREKARILSVVLTNRPMISNITVEAFVSFGRYPYSNFLGKLSENDVKLCKEAIQRSGISSLKSKWLSELSDGEMQKVQIARALAQNTPILLLDEPASHLDLVNKGEIFNLLSEIALEGDKTVLFTSHDIQFAMQLADNFIVTNRGEATQISAGEFKEKKTYNEILKSEFISIDGVNNTVNYKKPTS